jgi:hypothetical protein
MSNLGCNYKLIPNTIRCPAHAGGINPGELEHITVKMMSSDPNADLNNPITGNHSHHIYTKRTEYEFPNLSTTLANNVPYLGDSL